jgi:hypothetical protein
MTTAAKTILVGISIQLDNLSFIKSVILSTSMVILICLLRREVGLKNTNIVNHTFVYNLTFHDFFYGHLTQ